MTFGNFTLLESLSRGGIINFLPDQFATEIEKGLVTPHPLDPTRLAITMGGRQYIKKNKRPDFPACKVEKESEILYIC
jgi:hypothetical protein